MFIILEKLFTIEHLNFWNLFHSFQLRNDAADSTTNSNSDATVSYESDSDHELYFFEDEDSDENSDHHQ